MLPYSASSRWVKSCTPRLDPLSRSRSALQTTTYTKRTYCAPKPFAPLTAQSFKDPKVFDASPTSKLLFSYAVLRSCSVTPLVTAGTALLHFMECINLESIAHWVVERTYFKHFVAGKNLTESIKTAALLSKTGIGTILDYSIESADGNIDDVVNVLIDAIRVSGEAAYTPFSCFKVTALTQPHLLLRMNEILTYAKKNPSFEAAKDIETLIQSTNYPETVRSLIEASKRRASTNTAASGTDSLPKPNTKEIPVALTTTELETLLLPFAQRLERLGEAALKYNQAVLVDAEHSFYQEAIHLTAKCLMMRYNTKRPLFYNTYQMYLKAATAKLQEDLAFSKKHNLIWGAKLVRGAYMDSEATWAKEKGTASPILPSIEDTHRSYNGAVQIMLDEAKVGTGAVVIASHNEQSLILASKGVAERALKANHPAVHFGQLYGMCDHLSLALAHNGHNVVKYVPFGPVSEVMPYLLRRVEENKGFLSSTHFEQELMLANLTSRFSTSSKRSSPQPQL